MFASPFGQQKGACSVNRDFIAVIARTRLIDITDYGARTIDSTRADPDFVLRMTRYARQHARGDRLAAVLDELRPVVPTLLASDHPLALLHVPPPHADSEIDVFASICTLFFVPWAHGDCSQKFSGLHHAAMAMRVANSRATATGLGGLAHRHTDALAVAPVASFYEALVTDLDRKTRRGIRSGGTAPSVDHGAARDARAIDVALHAYTRALTGWLGSVLAW